MCIYIYTVQNVPSSQLHCVWLSPLRIVIINIAELMDADSHKTPIRPFTRTHTRTLIFTCTHISFTRINICVFTDPILSAFFVEEYS